MIGCRGYKRLPNGTGLLTRSNYCSLQAIYEAGPYWSGSLLEESKKNSIDKAVDALQTQVHVDPNNKVLDAQDFQHTVQKEG